ncbi:MAG TPA: hypothetical protein VF950_19565 [Planctomycetota bacterium]
MARGSVAILGLVLCGHAAAQDVKGVDQARVDAAIRKGVAFLKTSASPGCTLEGGFPNCDELILWTLVHAGVPENDPRFKELLKSIVEGPLTHTYSVSLQAMVLEEIDRVRHQGRIAQCAQFLVDNQCTNGQWGYGKPTTLPKDIPTTGGKPAVASGGVVRFDVQEKVKPKVTRKIPVRKQRDGEGAGDNSNTQYAVLGLRACHEAGIMIQPDVYALATKWWRTTQVKEKNPGNAVASGEGVDPGYWIYKESHAGRVYGMTAGGVGSLCILDQIQGINWKRDREVLAGLSWLASHWTPSTPGDSDKFLHYYYLYALERAGILYGTETLGKHRWYPEGAAFLLDAQKDDGSWDVGDRTWPEWSPVWDTCFAVLFLRRATRPLVVSVDRK